MEAGGDPARFWHITPAEVDRELRAMTARKKTHREELAWLAWHTAALPLLKKFPKLEDMIPRPAVRQTPEVMEANLKLALGFTGENHANE